MQSDAKTVDEYLTEVPADRLLVLQQIRRLCRLHLTGFEEVMAYGMPGYRRDGVIEVAFASQVQNVALYILRTDVLEPHRASFPRSAVGKGCIRYRNPDKIDYARVEAMLIATRDSRGPVC